MKKYLKRLKQNSMSGRKARFSLKVKLFALFILGTISFMSAASTGCDPIKTVITTLAISPVAVLGKKEEELTSEEKSALAVIEKSVNEVLKEYKGGVIVKDDFDAKIKEISETILEKLKEKSSKPLDELQEVVKNLSSRVEGMSKKGFHVSDENTFENQVDNILDSEKFNQYMNNSSKSTGKFELDLKSLTSFENSYTGDKLTTQQSNVVVSKTAETRVNLRDLMVVDQGDESFTSITFTQITNLDRNAAFESENGRLPQSSVKMKEVTYEVKRVGTYIPISKRLLKSRQYLKSFLMNRIVKWVRMAEDFQIMFGDGVGNNLLGIAKHPDVKCVSKIISDNTFTGVAGKVKYVDTYDGGKGTMIEFSEPIDSISTGQKITFTGALAGTYDVNKVNDRRILIEKSYSSITEQEIAALTFTVKNNFFNNVEDPNMKDAINAIFAVLTYGEYSPNGISLNPSTVFEISTAKDTTGRELNLVQMVNGVNYIGGRPVTETTAIKPGYYFAGDLLSGAAIIENSSVTIEVVEDLESKLTNTSNIIVDEEIIMPVYNPFAFAYGKLSDVLEAIKTKP